MEKGDHGLVVVTGAGGGLGKALALEMTRRGRTVVGIGKTHCKLLDTKWASFHPERFLPLQCDVGQPDNVRATFSEIRTLGRISVLINNAAVYPHRDLREETTESFMESVAVNLGGMVSCSLCALEDMIPDGRGRILNVSTFADRAPLPGSSAYSVSKAAARAFTRAMIVDLRQKFPLIVISDWMPGVLATSMGAIDGLDPAEAAKWGADLALWSDPSLNGSIWERNVEVLPPRSLRKRIWEALTFRKSQLPRMVRGKGNNTNLESQVRWLLALPQLLGSCFCLLSLAHAES